MMSHNKRYNVVTNKKAVGCYFAISHMANCVGLSWERAVWLCVSLCLWKIATLWYTMSHFAPLAALMSIHVYTRCWMRHDVWGLWIVCMQWVSILCSCNNFAKDLSDTRVQTSWGHQTFRWSKKGSYPKTWRRHCLVPQDDRRGSHSDLTMDFFHSDAPFRCSLMEIRRHCIASWTPRHAHCACRWPNGLIQQHHATSDHAWNNCSCGNWQIISCVVIYGHMFLYDALGHPWALDMHNVHVEASMLQCHADRSMPVFWCAASCGHLHVVHDIAWCVTYCHIMPR